MLKREVTLKNQSGLHARPASNFVKYANGFKSNISILHKDKKIDAKSIVSLLTGGLSAGATFTLQVEGSDELEAIDKIAEFLNELND